MTESRHEKVPSSPQEKFSLRRGKKGENILCDKQPYFSSHFIVLRMELESERLSLEVKGRGRTGRLCEGQDLQVAGLISLGNSLLGSIFTCRR